MVVASLSLHWSVPTCFVKEHRSSANKPATCPFPIGLFFWKLTPPACPGTILVLVVVVVVVVVSFTLYSEWQYAKLIDNPHTG